MNPHVVELYAAAAIFLTQLAALISSHVKGKRRDSTAGSELDKRLLPLNLTITSLGMDIRDLQAHVIGPDGTNGLRGDVRELKADVRGLLDRERDK